MPATQPLLPNDDEAFEGQPAPMPDEDGPHDVPDDEVIEKTLPAVDPLGKAR